MATYYTFVNPPDVDRTLYPPPFFLPSLGMWLVRDIHNGAHPASGAIVELSDQERDAEIGPKVLVDGELVYIGEIEE